MRTGKGELNEAVYLVHQEVVTSRMVDVRQVDGPRGATLWLVQVDGWAVAAVNRAAVVTRLDPGPLAPAWARSSAACPACGSCTRPLTWRPKTHTGLVGALRQALFGVL